MKTKVGFIGFGLIAGALAHALKESGRDYHITCLLYTSDAADE